MYPSLFGVNTLANPSDNIITIDFIDRSSGELITEPSFEVNREYLMTDRHGNIVLSYISDKTHQEIDVRIFKKGIYYLTITHGNLGKDQITVQIDN